MNKLTEQVRASLDAAHDLAGDFVGTEHLLLALATSPGVASSVLAANDLDRLAAVVPRGSGTPSGTLPFSPGSKRAIELALGAALECGDDDIGTAHVLMALMNEEGENGATKAVESLGATRAGLVQAAKEALDAGARDA